MRKVSHADLADSTDSFEEFYRKQKDPQNLPNLREKNSSEQVKRLF